MKPRSLLKLAFCLLILAVPGAPAGAEPVAEQHWSRPAEAGGPPGWGGSFLPEGCAACHRDKYEQWSGSLHARSVGPGLTGQIDVVSDPAFAVSCYRCHAPLVEQSEVTGTDAFRENPSFDAGLKKSGVSCAACHLRGGVVRGPGGVQGRAPHKSEREGLFKESAFCAACHQLEGGYELNGKPLTNTYREWAESVYSERQITCQACHMPGRRHLFKGIHDPETTRKGLRIEVRQDPAGGGRGRRTVLKITNTGVGHYFPTYVTPAVVIRGFVNDKNGELVRGTVKEAVIGRRVPLDLSVELFDTRIPPLGSFTFEYDTAAEAGVIVLEVRVEPDEFYTRFFTALIEGGEASDEIKEALAATEQSGYILFREELPLGP